MLNKDCRDMLHILLGNEVRFLVIGAYALGAYGSMIAGSTILILGAGSITHPGYPIL